MADNSINFFAPPRSTQGYGTVLNGTSAPASSSGFFGLSGQKWAAAGGLGLGVGGAIGSGISSLIQGDLEADLFGFNAKIAHLQAKDAISRGIETEGRFRTNIRLTIGAQRAALAAQGLDPNEGTALDIQADTARIGELDALTIRNNAAMEAWGYRVQEIGQKFQAEVAKSQAIAKATGTILQGASGAAGYFA